MRYERVKVTRDLNTVHNRAVAPWEIPVLEYLFEDGNVEHTDVWEEVKGEYPNAAKELDRLVRCYGSDPKSGVPYANSVYGNARAGERTLAKMIEEAISDDEAAAKESTPIPAPAKKRGRKGTTDARAESLLS